MFEQDLVSHVTSVKSESDEQLMLFVPFSRQVRLEAVSFALPFGDSCPQSIKLFADKSDIDFGDAESLTPTHAISIKRKRTIKGDGDGDAKFWSKSFPLKVAKFRNVSYLTVFVESNFGAEESELFKIELWGQN